VDGRDVDSHLLDDQRCNSNMSKGGFDETWLICDDGRFRVVYRIPSWRFNYGKFS
jgi:hypothetical protein